MNPAHLFMSTYKPHVSCSQCKCLSLNLICALNVKSLNLSGRHTDDYADAGERAREAFISQINLISLLIGCSDD